MPNDLPPPDCRVCTSPDGAACVSVGHHLGQLGRPTPLATVTPAGTVTFPKEGTRVLRDWTHLPVALPYPCEGGCGGMLMPGQLIIAFMGQPEGRMILGCWLCICTYAAERGGIKRTRGSLLGTDHWMPGPELSAGAT